MFVLDQARENRLLDISDRHPNRKFAFSHLYTALTRSGYRDYYLGLPEEWRLDNPKKNPVPKTHLNELKQVLLWLYGSKSDEISGLGNLIVRKSARHTSREFVAFLREVVSLCSRHKQIHIILDNLSAHKTTLVREFLEQNPRVHFHFTPTYSPWLNQVELWFARIERDVIARGIFTSVSDLARKLRRYINAYSANARPFQWKYSDPTRRIRTNDSPATVH